MRATCPPTSFSLVLSGDEYKIMKLPIVQLSPFSRYFILSYLRAKYNVRFK
jgi:hypothetical protein